jgi:hypothetical protein
MSKKYWLKGGLVALGLLVLIIVILYPFGGPKRCDFLCFPYWSYPLVFSGVFIKNFFDFISISPPLYVYFLVGIIVYFVLGALIGYFYVKFNDKRS